MNIEFKYNKDSNSYIISNETGKMKLKKNHPNMQEMLAQESIIEEISEKLNRVTDQKSRYLKTLAEIKQEMEKESVSEISTEITPVDYRTTLENRKLELQNMYQKSLTRALMDEKNTMK